MRGADGHQSPSPCQADRENSGVVIRRADCLGRLESLVSAERLPAGAPADALCPAALASAVAPDALTSATPAAPGGLPATPGTLLAAPKEIKSHDLFFLSILDLRGRQTPLFRLPRMMTSLSRIIGNRHLIVRMRIHTYSTELMEFFWILTE